MAPLMSKVIIYCLNVMVLSFSYEVDASLFSHRIKDQKQICVRKTNNLE